MIANFFKYAALGGGATVSSAAIASLSGSILLFWIVFVFCLLVVFKEFGLSDS